MKYDGTFDLDFLRDGERVRSAGDGSGACEIVSVNTTIRIGRGQHLKRLPDGSIMVEIGPEAESMEQQCKHQVRS